jgi:ComF family protein
MNLFQRYIINPLSDFIYPPICFICKKHLLENDIRVCTDCWKSFTCVSPTHPTWIELKSKFDVEGAVENIFSVFLFEKEGKLQEVVHFLKYQGMKSIGVRLGKEIGEQVKSLSQFSSIDYIIPVPHHKLKRRERGYNQSEYICKGISDVTKIPINTSIIKRRKYTQSQTKLDLQERKKNVGDAFTIIPKFQPLVSGKSFILVDDVITTGSTINACARTLLSHQANRIYAVSAALAE